MQKDELFSQVLDKDEHIVETFKPNKKRFIFINLLSSGIGAFIFGAIFLVLGILTLVGTITMVDEATGEVTKFPGFIFMGIGGLIVIGYVIKLFTIKVRYNKCVYAYSEKRIFIRQGLIGADYRTLDFDNIGGVNVNVDFLDKLVHPNSGSVVFSSNIYNQIDVSRGGGTTNMGFGFYHIDDPYGTYKRIKEVIDNSKIK